MSTRGIQSRIDRTLRIAVAVPRRPGRKFKVAGAEVRIYLAGLTFEGEPRFELEWSPCPPQRFTPEQFAQFDALRARAVREIREELER